MAQFTAWNRLHRELLVDANIDGARTRNAILPDGRIEGLNLKAGESLIVRNANVPVSVDSEFVIHQDASLIIALDDQPWRSTITVETDRTTVAGTLVLGVAPSADIEAMVGQSFQLFDRESFEGQFADISTVQRQVWDLAALYTYGTVKLLATPLAIDEISSAVLAGSTEERWDVKGDGFVTNADREYWVESIRKTMLGDANLDGIFDSADLVQVFCAGQYHDDLPTNSIWSTGDWNGDLEFSSRDLVVAFQGGGYQDAASHSVPEAASWTLSIIVAMLLATMSRRRT